MFYITTYACWQVASIILVPKINPGEGQQCVFSREKIERKWQKNDRAGKKPYGFCMAFTPYLFYGRPQNGTKWGKIAQKSMVYFFKFFSRDKAGVSVRRSLRPSVGRSVISYFFGLLGATYAVYTALLYKQVELTAIMAYSLIRTNLTKLILSK